MVHVTWTGAAGLKFDTGHGVILIDPYYTRISIFKTLLGAIEPDIAAIKAALPEMKTIQAVIVGHTHSDHALDVPFIADQSQARVVGSASLDTLMAISGVPGRTTVCQGGERIALCPSVAVTMIRSAHGLVAMGKVPFDGEIRPASTLPMKASGYRVGTAFAPRLELEAKVFMHFGSANFLEAELQGHTCDILFLCVPGWKKRQGYPGQIIAMTQPHTVVLFHYDDFSKPHVAGAKTRPMPLSDLKGLQNQIKTQAPHVHVIVPEIGQMMEF
jgi:L-ascorbate metabolism protein UlaG (beta-lactamase superfamily)